MNVVQINAINRRAGSRGVIVGCDHGEQSAGEHRLAREEVQRRT